MASNSKYMKEAVIESKLSFIDFQTLGKWFVSYYINPHSIKSEFSLVKLKNLIKPSKEKIKLKEFKGDLRVVKKISFNDGLIHLREENETKMDLYILNPNHLLVSKINFHQGALSINRFEKIVCTTHYQPYIINRDLVLDEYLVLALRNKKFQNHLNFLRAEGIKNEATYEFIGELEIPLPSLAEQDTIINAYNAKIKEAQALQNQADSLEYEIEKYFLEQLGITKQKDLTLKKGLNTIEYVNLTKWAFTHLNKEDDFTFSTAKFSTERIKNLIEFFEGGKTPSKARSDFWNGDIFWTSPKDFNGKQVIEIAEDRITTLAVKETGIRVFPKGIFLSVFRSGILQHSFPTAITEIETAINQDLKAYSLKEHLIDKYYYLHFVYVFKKYMLSRAVKKSVTVESINTEDFMEIQIPLPPLSTQKVISNHINTLVSQRKNLNQLAIASIIKAEEEFESRIFN